MYMPKNELPYHLTRDDDYYSDTFPLAIGRRIIKPENLCNGKKLHWHDFFEIEFVSKGSCEHILNNKSMQLKRGCAYIIRPIDFHNIFTTENCFTIYHIAFDIFILSKDISDILSSVKSVVSAEFNAEEANFIENNLKFLIKQFQLSDPNSKYILRTGVEQLIMMIIQKSNISLENQTQVDYPPIIQQITAYVGLHFRNQLHVYDIAKKFHLSTNYLGELFYKTIGQSFNNYLNEIRLEYSKKLLLTTNLTVSQICLESGFCTNSHFISLFKEKYGMTPNQLRIDNGMI